MKQFERHKDNIVLTTGAPPSYAIAAVPKPHRCRKNDLQPLLTVAGIRGMQCVVCKSVWRIEYRNNRVLNVYRDGVRQEVE